MKQINYEHSNHPKLIEESFRSYIQTSRNKRINKLLKLYKKWLYFKTQHSLHDKIYDREKLRKEYSKEKI